MTKVTETIKQAITNGDKQTRVFEDGAPGMDTVHNLTAHEAAKAGAKDRLSKLFVDTRVTELKLELNAGNKMLLEIGQQRSALDKKEVELRQTLLRISGAIQVLEEMLWDPNEPVS